MKHWLLLPLMLLLGFAQEMVKVNVNFYLEQTASEPAFYDWSEEDRKGWLDVKRIDAPFNYYYSHDPIDALHSFSRSQLTSLKWGLAIVFIIVNIILNYFFLKWAFQDPFFTRLLLWMMAVCFVLAGFFLVGGKVIGMPEPGYNIARKILGFMQSPVPALVLFVIGRLRSRI